MKVLLIEDSPNFAFLVEAMLRSPDQDNVSFTWADNLAKGTYELQQVPVDVILLDLSLPDSDGLATLTTLITKSGATPIIVLTGCDNEQLAIEAMRLGAQDYLLKSEIDKRGLLRALRYAIERRSTEEKYRELVESVDAIVWEADPVTWRFTFVSKAAEKILGYPIEHWLQASDFWVNLIHHDDRSRAVEYCQRQVEKGDDHEFEYRVVALDGRIVWLRDLVRIIKNESGRPMFLRGVMIDISQAKCAAAELQKHHDDIHNLQEVSQIILETPDPNTAIEKALEKCVAILDFDLGDVLLTTSAGELITVLAACGFRDPANCRRTPRPQSSMNRRTQLMQSEVVGDLQGIDRFRSLKKEGAETALIVPLRAGDESLGLLQLASRCSKQVPARDLALAETIGRQIGVAIQKMKLTEALQTSLQRMSALYQSNVAITSNLDLQVTLQIILEKLAVIQFPGTAITIQLIDGDRGLLEYFVHRNLDEKAWSRTFGSHRNFSTGGLWQHTIECKTPVVIQDLRTDPRVRHREFFQSQGMRSYLGVPIRIHEQPVGIVGIYTFKPYEFSVEELRAITSMAAHAAVAIHNARLYGKVEKQSRELAALFEVTNAATQSLEMDRVLEEVIRRINEIFLFDATRFFLFDDQQEWLHCRATHQVNSRFLTRTPSFKKGQGITGRVGATGVAIIFADTQANPQYQLLSQAKKAGQRFVAGFPVKYGSETLGVIMCIGEQPRRLTNHETDLVTSLSSQIAIAIANARLYEQTKSQAEQLRNLAAHLDSVLEQERTRISRELHDELGQALTGLKFDVAWINGKLPDSQAPLAGRLATMSKSLDDTIQAIRKISTRLRPDILDKLGLRAAIEWQLQEFRQRTGIHYQFHCEPIEIRLSEQHSTALFRILQEALINAARHSHASRVRIALEVENQLVSLRVDDDGDGIEMNKIFDGQSLGILGMRERAASLGGKTTIQRNQAHGTAVIARLPIEQPTETIRSAPRSEEL